MKRILRNLLLALGLLLLMAIAGAAWHLHGKQPQRSGTLALRGLQAPVEVRYDERGVPHIRAANEADLYRALGYVHAQDRLFQMEMARRLARGELAEVLGPDLLVLDRQFRTLGIRANADAYVAKADTNSAAWQGLLAYLDGINQYQAARPRPLEFELLGIPKRDFTPADTVSVAGYLAFSFANALRAEPVLTRVRDQLGPAYLRIFDLDWHPEGVVGDAAKVATLSGRVAPSTWAALDRIAQTSRDLMSHGVVPPFEGSNAWALSGRRTASGKPMLAGDPHIAYSTPAVWYEAHLQAPGHELYGHFTALSPFALLGHNMRFGWSLTMFQNDDMDLIVEKPNPANPRQVQIRGQWVDLQERSETIRVKGAPDELLRLRSSPHGPIITDIYRDNYGDTPVAMWWALLTTDNPFLEGLYELNRADTLARGRAAAGKLHAPGLNVVWANADGDIAWWAAAKLPIRPAGVNPAFLLDGSTLQADTPSYRPFSDNPQEENPARGYVLSANHQPQSANGIPVPGYYHVPERVQRLAAHLRDPSRKADLASNQAMQLDSGSGYGPRVLAIMLPHLRERVTDARERALLDRLAAWDGDHAVARTEPTLFFQLLYEIARAAMADELGQFGEAQWRNMLGTRALDAAIPRLLADEASPWWDKRGTPQVETRADTLLEAWRATLAHLRATYGEDDSQWSWGRAHTLTHGHPLGRRPPLDRIFNVGPFAAPGSREIPNAIGQPIGPAPWASNSGPSTRRVIDFADASKAVGINPVGQSGVLFDAHYKDQAETYIRGGYVREWFAEPDIAAHTRGTLRLESAR